MPRKKLTLEAVNDRLSAAKIGLKVWQRGDRLSLRGTLPPKPGAKAQKWSQQSIPLKVYANPAGLEYAEAKALEYGSLLAQKRFSWIELRQVGDESLDSCEAWIERFKKAWLKNQDPDEDPQATALRWREQFWHSGFSKLSGPQPLTEQIMGLTLEHWKPGSRSRQIASQKFQRLANFAEIKCDITSLGKGYTLGQIKRDIPKDADIEAAIDAMPRSDWQWVAAIMATYGLRDHEVFSCTLETRDNGVTVAIVPETDETTGLPTKTRDRVSYPAPPDWIERWNLLEIRRPEVKARINKEYGTRVAAVFRQQKMPFPPYSLRHAWNIRVALVYKLPTAVAAQFMGHDPTVNLSTYQKHISEALAEQTYLDAIRQNQDQKDP